MQLRLIFASVLAVACSFCVFTSSVAATTVRVSSLKGFESGIPIEINGALNMDEDFDLGTGTLILKGVTSVERGKVFTGSKGSVLDIDFTNTSEYSFTGLGVFLSGDLKFVKRGPGKVRLPAVSPHTGGTMVCEGVLDGVTGSTRSLSDKYSPFGVKGSTLEIAGGTVIIHAYYNMGAYYPVVLNGGCLKNDTAFASGKIFDGTIQVNADSTIEAAENAFPFAPTSISGTGKLGFGGNGGFTIGKDISMPTVSVAVGAPFALGNHKLEVKDYEVLDGAAVSGAGTITVNGTFKPTAGTAGTTFLKNGSKIDLSERTDVWSGDSVAFDANARVTIALGDRPLTSNLQIVSWKKKPSDVSFDFTGDNIGEREFTVSDGGIVYDAQSSAIASATWTGEGAAGNWMDPANWNCKNASGGSLKDEAPTVDMTVTFSGDVSDIAFNGQFPFAGVRFVNAELSKPCDWTGFDLNLLTDDSVLDMKGNALTVSAGAGESTTAATITNSGAEAEISFEVNESQTFTNGTMNIAGNVKFVKKGRGAFVAKKYPQEYTGITEVEDGVLRCGVANVNQQDGKSPFGAAGTVSLLANGVLDPAGSYYWGNHKVDMRGGSISNTVERLGRSDSYNGTVKEQFNPILNLYADSVMASTETFNFQGTVKLLGAATCLELRIGVNKRFLWNPAETSNLHLKVTEGGWLEIWRRAAVKADKNPGFTLEMVGAALSMSYYKGSSATYVGGLEAENYISSYGEEYNAEKGAVLSVSGTFTPKSDYFYGCTMLDGSTISIGGADARWSIRSKSQNDNTVKFAEGATVTIDVGPRVVQPDDVLVTWPEGTDYDGRKFELAGDDVEGLALSWDETGIKVVSTDTKVKFATWTDADGDGDFGNTNNWRCTNARGTQLFDVLPDLGTAVKIPVDSLANLVCPEKAFECASLEIVNENPGETVSLEQDCDWSGLGEMDFAFPIDLCGHDLVLSLDGVAVTNDQTVTNSAQTPARLFVSVPEGEKYFNAGLSLSGDLMLVKLGEGTYVAATEVSQTYTGGTIVSNGVLQCVADADLAACQPFGTQKTIDIAEDGVLDPAGSYHWAAYTLNMRGGSIANTVAQLGCENKYTTRTYEKPFDPTLELFAPTGFSSTKDFNFKGVIHANGNKLTMKTGLFTWAATTDGAAEVEFASGKLKTFKYFAPVTPEMTLVMNGAAFDFGCDALNVKDYIAKTTAYDAVRTKDDWRNANGVLNVSGVFSPVSQKFFGCTMLDGSTICLADKSGVWSTKAQSSNGNGRLFADFAESSEVTIDVHGRTFKGDVQIVQWEKGSTNNLDTVKFKLDDASRSAGYSLTFKPYVDDTNKGGLWIGRKGMMLLLR